MKLKLLILSICLIPSTITDHLSAQSGKRIPPEKPKLVVGIVVTQFRHDYISRYWDKFGDDGFKKLISRGTYCKNTSYNYHISGKGVGTATIATGTAPANHGIVAENWYNSLKEKIVLNVEDESASSIGGSFENGQYSPQHLLSTSFSDELKLSNYFKSKVIGISLEPHQAILSTGHTADASYWIDNKNGYFISSSYYMDSLPDWVNEFNEKLLSETYLEKEWNTLLPIGEYTESLPDANEYEDGYKGNIEFPYSVENLAKKYKKRERFDVLKTVPFGNNLVKDFAIQAIVNEELGQDEHTDVLMLSFTANEEIGNRFGPLSIETQDVFLRLDKEIAHFLEFIDGTIGKENVLIVLTAEHGLTFSPDYLIDHKIPAGYFNSASAVSLLKSYLNNLYGKGDWVKLYRSGQIYLDRTLIEDARLDLEKVQHEVANLMLQFHGVTNTLTATALQNTNYTLGTFAQMQNGYNQKRSGDVMIQLKNGWVDNFDKKQSDYGFDNRVPLIWYGWKIGRETVVEPIHLTDIAPTISVLLDINYPNSSTGKPIGKIISKEH